MSSIVRVFGTYSERGDIQKKLHKKIRSEGFVWMATGSTSTFYSKDSSTPFNECELIVVRCRENSHSFEPGEISDYAITTDGYLSPDYLVVLRDEDTMLFYLENLVPHTHAELGVIRSVHMLITAFVSGVLGLVVSLIFGLGWWSVLVGLGLALSVIVYCLILAFVIWRLIAATRGAIYIWWQVVRHGKSNRDYREIVALLGDCREPYLAPIHRVLYHLI